MMVMNKINRLVSEMKKDVKAYNKYITDEFLNKLSYLELLNHTHPIYREKYEACLKKYGIAEEQLNLQICLK